MLDNDWANRLSYFIIIYLGLCLSSKHPSKPHFSHPLYQWIPYLKVQMFFIFSLTKIFTALPNQTYDFYNFLVLVIFIKYFFWNHLLFLTFVKIFYEYFNPIVLFNLIYLSIISSSISSQSLLFSFSFSF